MKIFIFTGLLLAICVSIDAQEVLRTQILHENIKTLQVKVNGNALAMPIIELGGDDVLSIGFDEMSHQIRSYSYRVEHCNADWTPSSIVSSEYINGFPTGNITDYALSVNTTFLYTNYLFTLPNNDLGFIASGNYIVSIFENNQTDDPVARLRFYVVDPKVEIQALIRGNTDTEINRSLQQLDFNVIMNNYRIQDPHSELNITVTQNDRIDNAVTGLKPTFLPAGRLNYINNRSLIFEGGNEYRRIDFSSIYNFDEQIQSIKFNRPYYDVFVADDHVRSGGVYQTDFDVNGKFVINSQNTSDSDVEADYMYVHFTLLMDAPLTNGNVYIGGNWNYNQIDESSMMNYDPFNKLYHKILLLKQGGYNYQYWVASDPTKRASVGPIEGSFWQTQNEYAIYIYHRPWGGRYDMLIGVKIL